MTEQEQPEDAAEEQLIEISDETLNKIGGGVVCIWF